MTNRRERKKDHLYSVLFKSQRSDQTHCLDSFVSQKRKAERVLLNTENIAGNFSSRRSKSVRFSFSLGQLRDRARNIYRSTVSLNQISFTC